MKLTISTVALVVLLAASSVSADKAPRKLRGAASDAVDGKQRRVKKQKAEDEGRSGGGKKKGGKNGPTVNSGTNAAVGEISSLLAMLADIGTLGSAPPNFSSTGGAELSKEETGTTGTTAPGVWTPGAQGTTTNVQKVTPADPPAADPPAADPPVDPAMDPAGPAMDPPGQGPGQGQGTTQIITVPPPQVNLPKANCGANIGSLEAKGNPSTTSMRCNASCECQEECCIPWPTQLDPNTMKQVPNPTKGFCARKHESREGRASFGGGYMKCMVSPSQ